MDPQSLEVNGPSLIPQVQAVRLVGGGAWRNWRVVVDLAPNHDEVPPTLYPHPARHGHRGGGHLNDVVPLRLQEQLCVVVRHPDRRRPGPEGALRLLPVGFRADPGR